MMYIIVFAILSLCLFVISWLIFYMEDNIKCPVKTMIKRYVVLNILFAIFGTLEVVTKGIIEYSFVLVFLSILGGMPDKIKIVKEAV